MRSFEVANPVAYSWGASINDQRYSAVQRFLKSGSTVLDVGCGRGAYVHRLHEDGFHARGIDVVPYSEWRVAPSGTFICSVADRMPFCDRQFDYAISFEVLEHCPDALATLREMRRCVRHGIVLSVPDCSLSNNLRRYDLAMAHWTDKTHVNQFTHESIQLVVKEAGFSIMHVEGCYKIRPWKYFCETVRLPSPLKLMLAGVVERLRLGEEYWSSILVTAQRA